MSTNIRINIAGEFQKKGFDQANKATTALDKNFSKLRRTAVRTFVAVAGVRALKQSVQAFAQEDAAIQKLNKSLATLGLRFEASGINAYLDDLEKTSAVVKEDLYPAFQQLANTTLSVSKSQKLLNTALDVSAGTGKSLTSVSTALSRAFNGNFTSLGRLQTTYTSAQLEAMGFEKAVEALNSQFEGAALSAAETYEGQIKKLNIALEDAQEIIGEGVINSLEALGNGNFEDGLNLITGAAKALANEMKNVSYFVSYWQKFGIRGLVVYGEELARFKRDFEAIYTPDPAAQRTFMRERAKGLADEQKKVATIRKNREAATKAAKEEQKAKTISAAGQTFDLERIQIEAALKGKINDVEENRLKLQRAILNENTSEIIKYQGLLKDAEGQLATLQAYLASLPELAKNPFTDWKTVIGDVETLLKQLDYQIPIDVLFKNAGLQIDWSNMTVSQIQTMTVDAAVVNIIGATTPDTPASVTNPPVITPDGTVQIPTQPAPEPPAPVAGLIGGTLVGDLNDLGTRIGESTGQVLAEIPVATPEQVLADFPLLNTPVSEILGTQPVIDPAYIAPIAGLIGGTLVGNFQDLATRTGEPLADIGSTAPSFLPPFLSFDWSSMDMTNLGAPTPPIVVNVNVEGNVTTETDLVAAVTEGLQLNSRIGIPTIIDRLAV